MAATKVVLDGTQLGVHNPDWPETDTASGGRGQPIDGQDCAGGEALHIHAHLSIFMNGQQMAFPSAVGRFNCDYDTHTHDRSGVIHVESATAGGRFTLGQLFSVWGMPLSSTNVAGLADATGAPITVFIHDNFGPTPPAPLRYEGDVRAIEFAPQREITIQIGTPLTELQTYDWSNVGPEQGF